MDRAELFPSAFFRTLEVLLRRPPRPGPGSAAASRAGRGRLGFEHRPWELGDDPRRVDWRATARTAEVQVRRTEIERGGECVLILDRSASLAPSSPRRDLDQRRLALALGWLTLDAGGSVGLVTGGSLRRISGGERRLALQQGLEDLAPPEGGGNRIPDEVLGSGPRRQVFFIGDPWCGEAWWKAATACAARGDEVAAVTMILREEDDPPREGLRVRGVEGGGEVEVDLARNRGAYMRLWGEHLAAVHARGHEAGARPVALRCGAPGSAAGEVLRAAEEAGLV